eukprot:3725967-Amphidinium_carterae.1
MRPSHAEGGAVDRIAHHVVAACLCTSSVHQLTCLNTFMSDMQTAELLRFGTNKLLKTRRPLEII